MRVLGFRPLKTDICMTRQQICEHWQSDALDDWIPFLDRVAQLKRGGKGSPGLTREEQENLRKLDSILNENTQLYRCSWCTNLSAILRKCSGCGKTRCVRILFRAE